MLFAFRCNRALRSGADDETVICGLFHDVGEFLAPSCHGEIGMKAGTESVEIILTGVKKLVPQPPVCCVPT